MVKTLNFQSPFFFFTPTQQDLVAKPKKRKTLPQNNDDNKKASIDSKKPNLLKSTSTDISPTKYLALDCEMVGVEDGKSMLARVSIVNSFGNVIYDKFVRPQEQIYDLRTKVSGIRSEDLTKDKGNI